jgi:hypothetical protein
MSGASQAMEIPFKAARDMSAHQYKGVYISADDTVDVPSAEADAIGIQQDKPSQAGQGVRVVVLGKTRCFFGSDITVNNPITITTSGWVTTCASGTDMAMGRATKDASSGYIGECVLFGGVDAAIA